MSQLLACPVTYLWPGGRARGPIMEPDDLKPRSSKAQLTVLRPLTSAATRQPPNSEVLEVLTDSSTVPGDAATRRVHHDTTAHR